MYRKRPLLGMGISNNNNVSQFRSTTPKPGSQPYDKTNILPDKYNSFDDNKELLLYIKNNKVRVACVSYSLAHFEKQFFKKLGLIKYDNSNPYHHKAPCIFFGLYDSTDLTLLKNHKGKKMLMFGGTDADLLKNFYTHLSQVEFICISDDIQDRVSRSIQTLNLTNQIRFLPLTMVDRDLFYPRSTSGSKIYVYDGYKNTTDAMRAKNRVIYNTDIIDKIEKLLPDIDIIRSSKIEASYENMPSIYAKCFIGLRLTKHDGNANTVQEMEAMNIPIVHNKSKYGLKWKTIDDIVTHIKFHNTTPFDFYTKTAISPQEHLAINKNITTFTDYISNYKNILFICGDYPGYGGAATNCYTLQKYFKNAGHNTYGFYYNFHDNSHKNYTEKSTDDYEIGNINQIKNVKKKITPDIVILKSFINYKLSTLFDCEIIYLVGGIFCNKLNKYYKSIKLPEVNDYINSSVLSQIKLCDKIFVNSSHTQLFLKQTYNINTYLFYSSFIPFLNKKIVVDNNFEERKYNYGLICSNFNRPIKNIESSINYLQKKGEREKIILIGNDSDKYKSLGFKCTELVEHDKMEQYYKDIKYIVQDSFYESCSNVKIEGLMNGCKIKPVVVVSSTQYPSYGGAATNAYSIIKYLRSMKYNVVGVFFHNNVNVNHDPEKLGGIFIYDISNHSKYKVFNEVSNYLNQTPTLCLAKNYEAPILCKNIFNCKIVYLVSGINYINKINNLSANQLLNKNYNINKKHLEPREIRAIDVCDLIVCNSNLTRNIFIKLYDSNKVYKFPVDTSSEVIHNINNIRVDSISSNIVNHTLTKSYDIVICSSRLDRPIKNMSLVKKIFEKKEFDKYKKLVIGINSNKEFNNLNNCTCLGLMSNNAVKNYFKKSRVILIPSLFDSNPSVISEAVTYGCLPILSTNVGSYELFHSNLVCKTLEITEWKNKIKDVLSNYETIKNNNKLIFNNDNNIQIKNKSIVNIIDLCS